MNDVEENPKTSKRRPGQFDDALKGYYQDHDAVLPDEYDSTDYKSLTAESVGSFILGFLSALTFVSMLFIIFPLMGLFLGMSAIRKILRAAKELEGLGIASAGVALSVSFAVAATAYHTYKAQYEVPAGYLRITFADLLADQRTGQFPEHIVRLTPHQDSHGNIFQGRPVFIEGYMFPTRQMTELKSFMLVPHIEQGQFGSLTRNPTQMVAVTLSGDRRISYRSATVKVGGILTINHDAEPGMPPYALLADVFR